MGMIEEAIRLLSRESRREKAAEGKLDEVDLTHLTQVAVRTRPAGLVMDRDLVLLDSDGKDVAVPLGTAQAAGAFDMLQRLPGFNLQKFTHALTTEQDELVVCWRA